MARVFRPSTPKQWFYDVLCIGFLVCAESRKRCVTATTKPGVGYPTWSRWNQKRFQWGQQNTGLHLEFFCFYWSSSVLEFCFTSLLLFYACHEGRLNKTAFSTLNPCKMISPCEGTNIDRRARWNYHGNGFQHLFARSSEQRGPSQTVQGTWNWFNWIIFKLYSYVNKTIYVNLYSNHMFIFKTFITEN